MLRMFPSNQQTWWGSTKTHNHVNDNPWHLINILLWFLIHWAEMTLQGSDLFTAVFLEPWGCNSSNHGDTTGTSLVILLMLKQIENLVQIACLYLHSNMYLCLYISKLSISLYIPIYAYIFIFPLWTFIHICISIAISLYT